MPAPGRTDRTDGEPPSTMKGEGQRPSRGPDRCPTRTRNGPQKPARETKCRVAATRTSRRGADRAGFRRPKSDREIVAPTPPRRRGAGERFRLAVLEKNPCLQYGASRKRGLPSGGIHRYRIPRFGAPAEVRGRSENRSGFDAI